MQIDLRDYQKKACHKIYSDLNLMPNVLLQAIMGAGKTIITVAVIEKIYLSSNKKFLILVHKQELVEQFFDTFKKMSDVNILDIGICCAGLNQKKLDKRITIGTIQTFINHSQDFKCNLLVIDEIHRVSINNDSQYKKTIDSLRNNQSKMRILGITATPARRGHGYIYGDKCKKGNKNLFPFLNYQIAYKELVKQGYLMPLKGKIAKDDIFDDDIKNVNIGSDGDYKQNELGCMMSKNKHLESIKKAVDKFCHDSKKICIFCCTIAHAENVHKLFNNATIVHSKLTPLERAGNMQAWKKGNTKIMVSINILIEGFDFPGLDTLIMARPTLSSNLYLQAIGRVVRTAPEKTQALLIDLTDNTNYFGTDLDTIKVTIPKTVEKEFEKDLDKNNLKICPKCKEKIHKALKVCTSCGYKFKEDILTYINTLPQLKDIKFGENKPDIETYPVINMFMLRHQKQNKPDSVKVEYHKSEFGYHSVQEFLCFDHGGYATKKAQEWWSKMSFGLEPPANVDEALKNIKDIIKPEKIKIKKEGKYWRVIDHIFDKTAFYGTVTDLSTA